MLFLMLGGLLYSHKGDFCPIRYFLDGLKTTFRQCASFWGDPYLDGTTILFDLTNKCEVSLWDSTCDMTVSHVMCMPPYV